MFGPIGTAHQRPLELLTSNAAYATVIARGRGRGPAVEEGGEFGEAGVGVVGGTGGDGVRGGGGGVGTFDAEGWERREAAGGGEGTGFGGWTGELFGEGVGGGGRHLSSFSFSPSFFFCYRPC